MKHVYIGMAIFAILALALTACAAVPAAQAPAQAPTPLPATTRAASPNSAPTSMWRPSRRSWAATMLSSWTCESNQNTTPGTSPGVKLIPKGTVANRLNEIPKDKPVIVTCHSGNRSAQVTDYLRQQGYTNVHNMTGGISAWQQAGYPVEK